MHKKSLIALGLFAAAALATTIVLPLTLTSCSNKTNNSVVGTNHSASSNATPNASLNVTVNVKTTTNAESNIQLVANVEDNQLPMNTQFAYQWYYRNKMAANTLAFFSFANNASNVSGFNNLTHGWTSISQATSPSLNIPNQYDNALLNLEFMVMVYDLGNNTVFNVSNPVSITEQEIQSTHTNSNPGKTPNTSGTSSNDKTDGSKGSGSSSSSSGKETGSSSTSPSSSQSTSAKGSQSAPAPKPVPPVAGSHDIVSNIPTTKIGYKKGSKYIWAEYNGSGKIYYPKNDASLLKQMIEKANNGKCSIPIPKGSELYNEILHYMTAYNGDIDGIQGLSITSIWTGSARNKKHLPVNDTATYYTIVNAVSNQDGGYYFYSPNNKKFRNPIYSHVWFNVTMLPQPSSGSNNNTK